VFGLLDDFGFTDLPSSAAPSPPNRRSNRSCCQWRRTYNC